MKRDFVMGGMLDEAGRWRLLQPRWKGSLRLVCGVRGISWKRKGDTSSYRMYRGIGEVDETASVV